MTSYDISNKYTTTQYNINKYNYNHSYSNNKNNDTTYIFELILIDKLNNYHVIRRIKKSNKGKLISHNDKINYNLFDKYKLTVLNINDIDNPIIINDDIDIRLPNMIFNYNGIYLEINKTTDNLMIFKYLINN